MNKERVKELEDFAEDFNKRLEEAFERFNNNVPTIYNKIGKGRIRKDKAIFISDSPHFDIIKKKEASKTLFKEPEPWRPTHVYNRYFEKFKKLNPQYDMNSWEILRVNNMIKRSYEKIKDLPLQKDIKPGHGVGREFDELVKENKDLSKLSAYGDKLIKRFIKENNNKEKTLRKKEEELWEYRHSKPPLNINPWKPANHVITEFSVPPGDKIHSFRVEKKKPFLIQEPFRIPKKDGDYFYDRNSKEKIVY